MNMRIPVRGLPTGLAVLFLLSMFGLAVAGAYRFYSPIPFWDMWDGTLRFYADIDAGRYQAWWAQHNEHRILLSRALFWLDYRFFGGRSIFLIVVNYALVGFAALVFRAFLREACAQSDRTVAPLSLYVAGVLFLWTQYENLTWAFQSQFFLAQSLPLYGLLWMARHVRGRREAFGIACALGVLSPLAMANGMMALPAMALYLTLMRQPPARIFFVLFLWSLLLGTYLIDYTRPTAHSNPAQTFRDHAADVCRYVLLYLGSPANHLADGSKLGWMTATWSALVLLLASVAATTQQFRTAERSPYAVALLCFIFYILCTALITAAGRLNFGLPQALSPRYTTPALMAWGALLVIWHISRPLCTSHWLRGAVLFLLGACALLMLRYQLQVFRAVDETLASKRMAALALALGTRDAQAISLVSPELDRTLSIVRNAVTHRHGIFGNSPYSEARELLGTQLPLPATGAICDASWSAPAPIEDEPRYLRISGWWHRDSTAQVLGQIRVLDDQGQVIGLAINGIPVAGRQGQEKLPKRDSGFAGYLQASYAAAPTWLALSGAPTCRLPAPDNNGVKP